MDTKNRKILITGATGTIGESIVTSLADIASGIVFHYHSSDDKAAAISKFLNEKDVKHLSIKSELSAADDAKQLVKKAEDFLGGIDLLIHCAAVFKKTPLGEVDEESWDEIINANLKATFFLIQAAGINMQKDGGSIILFSDVAAKRPYAGYLPYCISKAGIDNLIKGLAKALAPKVIVNGIAPYIVTKPNDISENMWASLIERTPSHKTTNTDEIVELVRFLSRAGNSTTGQIISVDGGRTLK